MASRLLALFRSLSLALLFARLRMLALALRAVCCVLLRRFLRTWIRTSGGHCRALVRDRSRILHGVPAACRRASGPLALALRARALPGGPSTEGLLALFLIYVSFVTSLCLHLRGLSLLFGGLLLLSCSGLLLALARLATLLLLCRLALGCRGRRGLFALVFLLLGLTLLVGGALPTLGGLLLGLRPAGLGVVFGCGSCLLLFLLRLGGLRRLRTHDLDLRRRWDLLLRLVVPEGGGLLLVGRLLLRA